MGRRRSVLKVACLAAISCIAGLPAAAQGNACFELQARLVQIDRTSNNGIRDDLREHDAVIAQQRNELDRASAEARRAGCVGGFLIFQRRPEPKCPQLMATIDRMRANLTRLVRARGLSGGDPFALSQERNDILRSLVAYGCETTNDVGPGFPQPGGLLQSLFGQALFRVPGGGFGDARGFGAYRTLCVRTCDGYYFPISFSTLPAKFAADAATCRQMCPDADAALYIHRNPGEGTEAMVSLEGQPYTALPTAFRYRREYDRSCTCSSSAPLAGLTEFSTPVALASAASRTLLPTAPPEKLPMPRLRPVAAGEDPETVANRAGRLDPRHVAPQTADTETTTETVDGRKIRIVGPVDFYAQ